MFYTPCGFMFDKMKRLLNILLLWMGLAGTLLAQNMSFQNYTNQDGLPINNINDIVQDHDGFLWIATDAGLSRFDGYTFKTYTMDRSDEGSLPSNLIWRLDVDQWNKLWILTTDRGLCSFDVKTEQILSVNNLKTYPELLLSGSGWNIISLQNGSHWIIHDDSDFIVHEIPEGLHVRPLIEALDLDPPGMSICIKQDINGYVLLGREDGFYVVDLKSESPGLRQVSDLANVSELCIDGNRVFLASLN